MPDRFPTAPAWFRPVLRLEDAVLYRLRDRLPTTAHLHLADAPTANFAVNTRLGVRAVERLVPGANASPYMVQHVARYVWAMDICRGRDVVDLGCGDGYGTALLSWVARSAVGIDVSLEAVAAAPKRYPGVDYRVGDLTNADVIPRAEIGVCFEVLEHIAGAPRVLDAIGKRVARARVDAKSARRRLPHQSPSCQRLAATHNQAPLASGRRGRNPRLPSEPSPISG